MRARIGLRERLTALFVLIFGATLIGFSALLYAVLERSRQEEFDAALYNYTVDVASSIDVSLFGGLTLDADVLSDSEKVFPFALGQTLIQVSAITGQSVARSRSLGRGRLPLSQEDRDDVIRNRNYFRSLEQDDIRAARLTSRNFRLLTYLIDKPGPFDFVLQVAVPMILIEKENRSILTFFALSIPFVLVLAAFGGLYVSRRALAPVTAIIGKTRAITHRELGERVPVPEARDEIRELAVTLNELLDRLERAFRGQETFVADASHQLKTPLAILRGELDVFRGRPRDEAETREFLESAAQEIGYLSRMVEDLLVLARVDAGPQALERVGVRLDEITLEVVARLERLSRSRGVRVALSLGTPAGSAFEVPGDPDLLRCLVENLLENGIKYSPEGGTLNVGLYDSADRVTLEVGDQGPGIPPEALGKIFDRFYRSETTRDRVSGSGLGLAIAQRIAAAHGSRVEVESAPGRGSQFRATLFKGLANGPEAA